MSWTWERLSDVVRRLKLPAGEYVLGRVGYGLSSDRSSTADRVELLVTETGWKRLKERGWRERSGGVALRHPDERHLTASIAVLADVRHEIAEVDGVPVIAVEPDPPAARPARWRQRASDATFGLMLAAVLGAIFYSLSVYYPTPSAGAIVQHLTFRTTEVEATVEDSSDIGTCARVKVYESELPRIKVTLTWIQDGQERTGTYTGCDAAVDSPQDVWVTSDGEVASQHSPWVDHFWPAVIVGLVPFAFIVMPLVTRLRGHLYRRRHRA